MYVPRRLSWRMEWENPCIQVKDLQSTPVIYGQRWSLSQDLGMPGAILSSLERIG
ncbi:MAG: hypothetical protein KAI84_08280 [Gammaproteobacteria bacterium]|nr:hypothetical protein [Gammaproteobacteria bacterium]